MKIEIWKWIVQAFYYGILMCIFVELISFRLSDIVWNVSIQAFRKICTIQYNISFLIKFNYFLLYLSCWEYQTKHKFENLIPFQTLSRLIGCEIARINGWTPELRRPTLEVHFCDQFCIFLYLTMFKLCNLAIDTSVLVWCQALIILHFYVP